MKDSVIVLSGLITPDMQLDDESKKRIDKGIELLENNVAKYIIMNGGFGKFTEEINGNIFVPRNTVPTNADLMKQYALSKSVPIDKILTQNYSADTVGEIFFVEGMHLNKNEYRNNIIVTSKYHVMRASGICNFIFNKKYSTDFVGVSIENKSQEYKNIFSEELVKLNIFFEQMKGIVARDSKMIEKRIYEKHNLYNNIPVKDQLRFYSK